MSRDTRTALAEFLNLLSMFVPIGWGIFVFCYVLATGDFNPIMYAPILVGISALFIVAFMMVVVVAVGGVIIWAVFRFAAWCFTPLVTG